MKEILVMYGVPSLVILFGVFNIFGAIKKKQRCTARTVGTIVEIKEDRDSDSKTEYSPVYQYNTGTQMIRKKANFSTSSKRKYKLGDTTEIFYDPKKPELFYVKGQQMGYAAGIFLIIMGGVLMFIFVNYATFK
ncbi:MAG: DUF3592 domain-containing protein [Firmicutes bacterium]|nr:DUF3592 domain-containing protein [Bacillota bacterium]